MLHTDFCNDQFRVVNRLVMVTNDAYLDALNGKTFGGAFACELSSGNWSSTRAVNVLTDITSCSEVRASIARINTKIVPLNNIKSGNITFR